MFLPGRFARALSGCATVASLSLVAQVLIVSPAIAQPVSAIAGTVVEQGTGAPVAGAQLLLHGDSLAILSDTAGSFQRLSVTPGTYLLEIRALGFVMASRVIVLVEGDTLQTVVELKRAELPGVTVKGKLRPGYRRFNDFERRRKSGRGTFFTRSQIEKENGDLSSLLRNVRGMREDCSGGHCVVRMARSQIGCVPEYYIDGTLYTTFGNSTPLLDIQGIEVYLGPSEIPPEFLGANAGCGVIVLWTKSAPRQ